MQTSMNGEFKAKSLEFQRNFIEERLALCSQKQRDFAHKMFGNPIREDALDNAADVVERCIKKNEADPSRLSQ